MRWILGCFGFEIVYECEWGLYHSRYDSTDAQMRRPIHPDMMVAPPWATMLITRTGSRVAI
jgi:hypothetical protein